MLERKSYAHVDYVVMYNKYGKSTPKRQNTKMRIDRYENK